MSDRHAGFARSQAGKRRRRAVLERDGWRCVRCGLFGQRLEVDHVTPLEAGGDHSMDNLQTLCRVCHLEKTRGELTSRHVEGQDEWSAWLRQSRYRRGRG